jgi:predicted AlkP superfamily phosphohydrolase/phosphomutase
MAVNKRLIILGLDGGSISILKPMAEEGVAPGFNQVFRYGTYGNLYVDPNERGWPNILTGMPVDYLGSFYYWRERGQYLPRMSYDPSSIFGRTILDQCAKAGYRVLAINLPLTYPAWDVNGLMVSGAGGGTSPRLSTAVNPISALKKYDHLFRDYVIDLRRASYIGKPPQILVEDLLEISEKRIALIRELMAREEWDLAVPTFVGFDRLQHWLWDALPIVGKQQDRELTPLIQKFYSIIDQFLSELLDRYNDANLLLISDHGFQGIERYFYINTYLKKQGYLKKRRGGGALAIRCAKRITSRYPGLRKKMVATRGASERSESAFRKVINWGKTEVYGFRAPGLYVNSEKCLEGILAEDSEEYERLLAEISDVLTAFKPDGQVFFQNIRKKCDFYKGPYGYLAPDIIFDVLPGTEILPEKMGEKEVLEKRLPLKDWLLTPSLRQGIHSSSALFAAVGPDILPSVLNKDFRLVDFAKTVLDYFGLIDERHVGKSLIPLLRQG